MIDPFELEEKGHEVGSYIIKTATVAAAIGSQVYVNALNLIDYKYNLDQHIPNAERILAKEVLVDSLTMAVLTLPMMAGACIGDAVAKRCTKNNRHETDREFTRRTQNNRWAGQMTGLALSIGAINLAFGGSETDYSPPVAPKANTVEVDSVKSPTQRTDTIEWHEAKATVCNPHMVATQMRHAVPSND